MKNSQIVWKNQKALKTGYTTGSCAAAAAKAATYMLLNREIISQISLMTPKGIMLYLDVEHIECRADSVSCAIRKESGDDPDVTNGVYVYAKVSRREQPGIQLDGGTGVGRVTKKGLEQTIGQAAINKVPRRMILEAVREQTESFGYQKGLSVVISIPEGISLAKKTFNPRLGIEGGISVLGTSGIVEPMSERALLDTIFLEMKMLRENGYQRCYVVPGNYGSDFLTDTLGFDGNKAVKCSNYIGETIDDAVRLGMKELLLIGHIGKVIKIAAGVMNTHSRQADCRMEVLAAHAAMAGIQTKAVQEIMEAVTTTDALDILHREGVVESVMESVMRRISFHLKNRSGDHLQVEAIMFSNEEGILGMTEHAGEVLERIAKGE
ncbi:MAG: cobalt-precorrin-5B (C(1))-methyltransferase CbiD [Hespellia sp.]|nr:cobalt-precorrin-5B (C(1))-methyltransferase CbiD [Hespellia sp.]